MKTLVTAGPEDARKRKKKMELLSEKDIHDIPVTARLSNHA